MSSYVVTTSGSVSYFDTSCPCFEIGGIENPSDNRGEFYRLDAANKSAYGSDVRNLAYQTSGVTLRFRTNAPYIYLNVGTHKAASVPDTFCSAGAFGFDVYVGTGTNRRCILGKNEYLITDSLANFYIPLTGNYEEVQINFPICQGVSGLYIGLPNSAYVAAPTTRTYDDICFYGSAATQGYAVMNNSATYPSIVSRMLNADCMNLGFTGSALGQQAVADYIASRNISAFVMDYDFDNTESGLSNTHYAFYKTVRDAHPDIPILLLTRPVFSETSTSEETRRQAIVKGTYDRAVSDGDDNVYYLAGTDYFTSTYGDLCTADFVNPNELGHYHMARAIFAVLDDAMASAYPEVTLPSEETTPPESDSSSSKPSSFVTHYAIDTKFTCQPVATSVSAATMTSINSSNFASWDGNQFFMDGATPYAFVLEYAQVKWLNFVQVTVNSGSASQADLAKIRVYVSTNGTTWTDVGATATIESGILEATFADSEAKYVMLDADNDITASGLRLHWRVFSGGFDPALSSGDVEETTSAPVTEPATTDAPESGPLTSEPDPDVERVLYTNKTYYGNAIDLVINPNGTVVSANGNWSWYQKKTDYQFLYDGSYHYYPYVAYAGGITINELIIGDVSHWNSSAVKYTDYGDLEIYCTNDPNGTWSRISCTVVGYNCDVELDGTYMQGIRFIFDIDVTATYFLLYDASPAVTELWLASATFTGVFNDYPVVCPHTDLKWKTVNAATCTSDGLRVQVCNVCGETLQTETIPGGHTEVEWRVTVAPVGFEAGEKVQSCGVCGKDIATAAVYNTFGLCDEDNVDKTITGIGEKVSSSTLKNHYSKLGYNVTILSNDGYPTFNVGTGCRVIVDIDNSREEYVVIVKGDVNGDSAIDIFDLHGLLSCVNSEATLEGTYKEAGLLISTDEIDLFDLTALLAVINNA
ncbi:MAG: hypothetical protein IJD10_06810 [Clostridia bacterium]|nr:hypothetical protein [Clostridia bacterium]